jgi:hypothetical protein
MRFSVNYSPDEDTTTAADELGTLSSMRQLGETPAVPARTDTVHGCQWSSSQPLGAGRAETARARVGAWRAAAAHRCGLGIQSGCPAACTRVSSACIGKNLRLSSTRIHMQQTVQRYAACSLSAVSAGEFRELLDRDQTHQCTMIA